MRKKRTLAINTIPLPKKMHSFSPDSCASADQGATRHPPLNHPSVSAFSAPYGENTARFSENLAPISPDVLTSPLSSSALPSRLRFSPATDKKVESSSNCVSSPVPQQNGFANFDPSRNSYLKSTSSLSEVGQAIRTSANSQALHTHRPSLDGSFRIIGPSSSSSRVVSRATDRTRETSASSGVHNSTPLSADGTDEGVFDLRCSGIASPILRSSQTSTSTPTGAGDKSLPRFSRSVSGLSACSPNHAQSPASSQGSQLSIESVVTHSYVPKRPSSNPLGIYPRRPINQRSKDLNLTLFSAFSSNRVASVLTPVFHRIQDGISNVVETMSPRKRPQSRSQKSHRQTVDSGSQTVPVLKTSGASESPKDIVESKGSSTSAGLLFIASAFASCLLLLYFLYTKVPQLTDEERALVKYPRSLDDAKGLAKLLSAYKDDHFSYIVLGFFAIYNFLQTFAIPGSIFLSILSGFLFPFPLALFLVSLCSALGASFCYLLSSFVGRPFMNHYFASRVEDWRLQVERQRQNLLSYIIFLRITPFLPNWFINITSPIIDVPLSLFFLGTFVGVAPPSFVYISAGQTVHTLTSTSSILTWGQIGLLASIALLSLLPVVLKDKLKRFFE